MYSIIERLFDGQAGASEHGMSEKYYKIIREFGKSADRLSENLCPQRQHEFDEVLKKFTAVCERENEEMYYTGFCMGARIMLEVLQFAL